MGRPDRSGSGGIVLRVLLIVLVLVTSAVPASAQMLFANDVTDFSSERDDADTGVPAALQGEAPARILNAKWVNTAIPLVLIAEGPAQADTVGLLAALGGSNVLLPGMTGKFHAWYGDWSDGDRDGRLPANDSLYVGAPQANRDCQDRRFERLNAAEPVGPVPFPAPVTAPEAALADCRSEIEWRALGGAVVVGYVSPNRPYDTTRPFLGHFERDGRPDLVYGESSLFREGIRYLASDDGNTYMFHDGSLFQTLTVETYVDPLPTQEGPRTVARNATQPHDVDVYAALDPTLEALYADTVDRRIRESGCDKDNGVDGNLVDLFIFPDGSCLSRVPFEQDAVAAADAALAAANAARAEVGALAGGLVTPVVDAVLAQAGPVVAEARAVAEPLVAEARATADPVVDGAVATLLPVVADGLAAADAAGDEVFATARPAVELAVGVVNDTFTAVFHELDPVVEAIAESRVPTFGLVGPQVAKVLPPQAVEDHGFDYAEGPHTYFDVRLAQSAYRPLVVAFGDGEVPPSGAVSMDASGRQTAPLLAGVYGVLGLWHDRNADGWIGEAFPGDEECEDAHFCGALPDPNDYGHAEFAPFCRQGAPIGAVRATLTSSTGTWGATGVYVMTDTEGIADEGNEGPENSARAFNPWDDAVLDVAADGRADHLRTSGAIELRLVCDNPSFGYRSFEHVLFPEGGNRGYAVTLATEWFESTFLSGGQRRTEAVHDVDVMDAMAPLA